MQSQEVKAQMAALLKPEELQQFAVKGSEEAFAGAVAASGRVVSVKSTKAANGAHAADKPKKRKGEGMLYKKQKKGRKKHQV